VAWWMSRQSGGSLDLNGDGACGAGLARACSRRALGAGLLRRGTCGDLCALRACVLLMRCDAAS
jgi:hypothetical protein